MMRGKLVVVAVVAGWAASWAAAAGRTTGVCIPLHGRVDEFMVEEFQKRLREAYAEFRASDFTKRMRDVERHDEGKPPERRTAPDLILFDLHTTAGSAAAAFEIADTIYGLHRRRIATAALVHEPGSPATTLMALACEQLFLTEKASLVAVDPGAFDPKATEGEVKELMESVRWYTEDRPRLRPLYEAFVEPGTEVYAVVFEGREGKTAFYPAAELKRLMASSPERVVRSERVVKAGERAALGAAEAERLRLSMATVATAGAAATRLKIAGSDLRTLAAVGKPAEKPKVVSARPSTAAEAEPGKEEKPAAIKPIGKGEVVVFVPLDGMVGDGMFHSLKRRLRDAEALEPALIVFEMNTYGGKLISALDIANEIFDLPKPRTVAYVNDKAISAGALISVACDEIVMQAGSELGDCGVVDQEGYLLESEKIDTVVRARFRSFCEGKYPGALAMAMVTKSLEVYQGTTRDGQHEYFTGTEWENLTPEERERFIAGKKVVDSDTLLTMTDKEARDYGFSRATVTGRKAILEVYGLGDHKVQVLSWNWSESFVRTLDTIGPLLLTLGLLFIIIELKTPGFGFFGLTGLALVAVFFFGKYTAGLAEAWEILLFVVGVALLAVEIFVTPGFGVLGVLGILAMFSSLLLSLQWFTVPSSPIEQVVFERNLGILAGVVLGVFLGIVLIARHLHRAPYLGRMVLPAPAPSTAPTSVTESVSPAPTAEQAKARESELVGRQGRAVTMLRPAGRAEFEGEPLDVVTEGDFIHPGEPIEILRVRGNRIVVKRAT